VSCHVSCHSTGISDGRPASMCTHVWQKATTRSAERRPMSGLGTGNGRGKQKQKKKKKKINDRVSGLPIICLVCYVPPAGRRAPATYARLLPYLPRALRSLGAVAPRPGPRRARHRTTAPAPWRHVLLLERCHPRPTAASWNARADAVLRADDAITHACTHARESLLRSRALRCA
jgi:hypothetical protein